MDNRAIGVFDSGLGGLTLVKELHRIMPQENIVYLGDTARIPYGTRSRETILRYAQEDIAFLQDKDVKMIVAACGTVSSTLTKEITSSLAVPFVDVILPTAQAACALTSHGKSGSLARRPLWEATPTAKPSATSAMMYGCLAMPAPFWSTWWKTA